MDAQRIAIAERYVIRCALNWRRATQAMPLGVGDCPERIHLADAVDALSDLFNGFVSEAPPQRSRDNDGRAPWIAD